MNCTLGAFNGNSIYGAYCGYSLMNVRGGIPEHCPKCDKELKSVIGIMDSVKKDLFNSRKELMV